MKVKELKKGMRVRQRNGWEATLKETPRFKATVLATVYGFVTEMGSIYTHDILEVLVDDQDDGTGEWEEVTDFGPAQLRCKASVEAMGW